MEPLDIFTLQSRLLVQLVHLFKVQVKRVEPEGWSKLYLISLLRSVVTLQRAIRLMDTYSPFVRYLRGSLSKDVLSALSYDALKDFRQAVIRYDNKVNDTFLFVEDVH